MCAQWEAVSRGVTVSGVWGRHQQQWCKHRVRMPKKEERLKSPTQGMLHRASCQPIYRHIWELNVTVEPSIKATRVQTDNAQRCTRTEAISAQEEPRNLWGRVQVGWAIMCSQFYFVSVICKWEERAQPMPHITDQANADNGFFLIDTIIVCDYGIQFDSSIYNIEWWDHVISVWIIWVPIMAIYSAFYFYGINFLCFYMWMIFVFLYLDSFS